MKAPGRAADLLLHGHAQADYTTLCCAVRVDPSAPGSKAQEAA
jgi:hypothetical protein